MDVMSAPWISTPAAALCSAGARSAPTLARVADLLEAFDPREVRSAARK